MLLQSIQFLQVAWWMSFFPGIFLALLVLSMNLIGDGLSDVLNPRLHQ
jgi:peptide/nickel transport system permease protein